MHFWASNHTRSAQILDHSHADYNFTLDCGTHRRHIQNDPPTCDDVSQNTRTSETKHTSTVGWPCMFMCVCVYVGGHDLSRLGINLEDNREKMNVYLPPFASWV